MQRFITAIKPRKPTAPYPVKEKFDQKLARKSLMVRGNWFPVVYRSVRPDGVVAPKKTAEFTNPKAIWTFPWVRTMYCYVYAIRSHSNLSKAVSKPRRFLSPE